MNPLPTEKPPITADEVKQHAREIFGDAKKCLSWLNRPNPILHGMRPQDLIDVGSKDDLWEVWEELDRIDQGLF
jgi:uncharacterized protein (DUF2384 family)